MESIKIVVLIISLCVSAWAVVVGADTSTLPNRFRVVSYRDNNSLLEQLCRTMPNPRESFDQIEGILTRVFIWASNHFYYSYI